MKQMCEKRSNVLNLRESLKSGSESVRNDLNDQKTMSRMWDSRSSSKGDQSTITTKVDKHPIILSPENTDSSTEHLTKSFPIVSSLSITNLETFESVPNNEKYVMCPEIGTSRTVCFKSTTCESNSSKSMSSFSLPAVEFSKTQRKISQSYEIRQTNDCLKLNEVKEISVKRPISSVDSTSNTKTPCKKPHFEYNNDETEEAKGEPKINCGSSGDKKTYNLNVSKVSSSSNKPGTSKLHYKSVLQFKSNR